MSIGKKLILVNISILLVGVLLLTAVFVRVAETQIRTLVNREISLVAQKEGKEIQRWLEVYLDAARTLAQIMERFEDIAVDRRRSFFNLVLSQMLATNPEIVGAWSVWEPNRLDGLDAQFAGTVGANAVGSYAPWWLNIDGEIKLKTSVDYEWEGQGDFYQIPVRTGKESIIDPTYWMIEGKQKLLVDVSVPIKKDGVSVGAVGFDIDAPVIQARIMAIQPYEGSVSAVYSSRGVICGHFDPSRIGKEMSLTEQSLAGDNLEGLANAVRQGETFSFFNYVPDLQENMFFIAAPFSIGKTDAPWTLMVGIPAKIITAPVYRALAIGLVIGLVLIALIVVATIFNAYSISNPLNQMMKSFNSIENAEEYLFRKGQFIQNLPSAIVRQQNEIGELAMAFLSMSEALQEVVSNIEYITASARGGNLLARAKTSSLRGNYLRILKGLNNAMDVICDQFDAVPDAIALFDISRNLVYRNHVMNEFIKLHGFDANDGQFFAKILARTAVTDWEEKEKGEAQVDALFTPNEGNSMTYTADIVLRDHMYAMTLKRSGKQRPLNSSIDSLCVMLLLTDITGIAKARLEAEAASRAKSDFLSRMSHEIRTPLNAVMGMTQIALRTDSAEKMQSCLEQIDTSSAHLLGVINDILDFSKLEADKLYLEPVEFSLIDDIGFVVSMMQCRAKERRISIRLELGEIHNDCLFADSLRLNQALINLLSNAIKFSPTEGEVRLIVKELADDAVERGAGKEEGTSVYYFEVVDEGIGIDEKQAAKLFQPFEQADGSIARSYGGTGLGLVISKNIVEMMGGTITLKSKQGEGSSFAFTIRCPACNKKLVKKVETDEVEIMPDFSSKRCLIVDDIDINREILGEILEDTGIAIEMASNGNEAVACFEKSEENYYDIILMDIQMPVMDGCTATKMIRSMPRKDAETLPIIAMTADVIQEDVIKMRKAGMNEHLGKPIDMNNLFKTLKEFLPA
ncbi:MAG: response regulator [Treponema sp.]|jgi:signal transduction histidine kinase/ActR/RegA family two-component response regulator/cell division protein FtsL|nr:response regulator [Treponema sp.]